ncbi:hypothetical protein [Alteromonas sp. RKMC-009]|uniref:hypothetical protein n=1 Tax=Alteromonas sp. RKMC-009 TaxID=2267264 RepID=UPI000E69400B|nr:hypothetical protein [Alteromonas sp. RKMC-009]AYA63863.1 hypothetical protein DS731_07520 [Alteromonas sp. RKMC-009]
MTKKLCPSHELKMAELEQLNLPKLWRDIAKATGPDIFLKIWRIVSAPEYQWKANSIYVPSINRYYEFQRIQITKTLLMQKKSKHDVVKALNTHGIKTSLSTVERIAKKHNLKFPDSDEIEIDEVSGTNYQMSLF